jgi:hypothetical protein
MKCCSAFHTTHRTIQNILYLTSRFYGTAGSSSFSTSSSSGAVVHKDHTPNQGHHDREHSHHYLPFVQIAGKKLQVTINN